MRLYHFLNAKYGLLDIRHRRLKIARINELNDPFEFLGVATKSRHLRRRYQQLKDDLNGYLGLVCFSANWNNPVQWSHYADCHQGLCLGFEVTALAHKVNYASERLIAKPSAMKSAGAEAEAHVMEILTTKFEHWIYEDEYRVFPQLQEPDQSGLCFLEFDGQVALREVIVGPRSIVRMSRTRWERWHPKCRATKRDWRSAVSTSSVKRTIGFGSSGDESIRQCD